MSLGKEAILISNAVTFQSVAQIKQYGQLNIMTHEHYS
jgi:hypothetical protein